MQFFLVVLKSLKVPCSLHFCFLSLLLTSRASYQCRLRPSYSYFFVSIFLHDLSLTHTYIREQSHWLSKTYILAQRDGHVTSSCSPSQFRAECRMWHCCLRSYFPLIRAKTLKTFLLCESNAGNPHYTKGHQGFECVFVAFCFIFALDSFSRLLLFPFPLFPFQCGYFLLKDRNVWFRNINFDLCNSFFSC